MAPCDEVRVNPNSCDAEDWGSNYGQSLDVAAPGVKIYTTDIQGTAGYNAGYQPDLSDPNYTRFFNGTSSAVPQVTVCAPSATGLILINILPSIVRHIWVNIPKPFWKMSYNLARMR